MIALTLLQLYIVFVALPCARATIFVTAPSNTTTCHAGQPCSVQWLDDGSAPLLTSIGPCLVGLYNGQGADPSSGPDSDLYYINFTSVNPVGNPPTIYTQYSPFFTLSGMTGSFASPVASDTKAIPVPSSVVEPSSDSVTSTILISHPFSSPLPSTTAPAHCRPLKCDEQSVFIEFLRHCAVICRTADQLIIFQHVKCAFYAELNIFCELPYIVYFTMALRIPRFERSSDISPNAAIGLV
ncbi:hypothetical protein NM688_g6507 [Phlebia brevispora]|uniref:Uncharacterized protein n=1 Tax=Phlebia brevispora TaxID=194682 RepID=A0ACC1SFJ8_9APHY|nr:hypothetical protein NM688_g6507 [Phlebia brevispora]